MTVTDGTARQSMADAAPATRGFGRTLIISLGGAGFGALAAFLVAAIVGRLEGPDGAGLFFQFVAMFTIAVSVLKIGADSALIRSTSQLRALHRSAEISGVLRMAVLPVLAVGTAVTAVVVALAQFAAEVLVSDPELVGQATTLIRILAPLALCSAVFYLVLGALRGVGSVTAFVGMANIALPAARIVLVSTVLAGGATAAAAIVAWAGTIPLWCALAGVLLWRRTRRLAAADEGRAAVVVADHAVAPMTKPREFWTFSTSRWAAATVETVLEWIDVLLVGALLSPAAAGVYAVATRVIRAGQVVDNAMRVAVGPRIGAAMALGHRQVVRDLYATASQAMLVLTLPFYVTCLVFAEPILRLFGDGFDEGATALRVLALGIIVSAATIMSQSIVLLAGRSHWQLQNKSVALAIVVAGNLLLVPRIGITGAAAAWAVAISVDAMLVSRQARRLIGGRFSAAAVLRPLLLVGGGVTVIGLLVRLLGGASTTSLFVHLGFVAVAYGVGVLVAMRVYGFRPKDLLRAGD